MHDSVGKSLQGIALSASALALGAGRDPAGSQAAATQLAAAAKIAAAEARELIGDLRADDLGAELHDAVAAVAHRWAQTTGVAIELELRPVHADADVRYELLAIANEALRNVERHARASTVRIALTTAGGHVRLEVVDDGCGLPAGHDPERLVGEGHFGLLGMSERAAAGRRHARRGARRRRGHDARSEPPRDDPSRRGAAAARAPPAATPASATSRVRGGCRMIRIVIVDDNAIVLQGTAAVIAAVDPGIEIVATGSNGREAIALAREHRPDVLLLDVQMPIMDGIQAAEALAGEVKVLMLSYAEDEHRVTAAIRAGACGYLVHGRFEPAELADGVRRAARGETVISPAVASTVFSALRRGPDGDAQGDPLELTPREREIMTLVAAGLTNGDIARKLVLSEKTVKNHVHNTYRKLGVTRRGQAIAHWLGSAPQSRGG